MYCAKFSEICLERLEELDDWSTGVIAVGRLLGVEEPECPPITELVVMLRRPSVGGAMLRSGLLFVLISLFSGSVSVSIRSSFEGPELVVST